MTTLLRRIKIHTTSDSLFLGLVLAAFALIMLFVNPLREFGLGDDWAYALTVKSLVQTGVIRSNEWLPAWIPSHIYWGALFSTLFGFSFSSLHLSTVVLVVVGLVGFYFLAREHGIAAPETAVLCLIMIGSPLVIQSSTTFMTDAPYLTYLILSLLFYTRGVRLKKHAWMLAGGVSAGLTIMTRLFGAAIIPGLGLVWLLDKDRRKSLPLFITGLALPIVVLAWVLYESAPLNSGTAAMARNIQQLYFNSPGLVASQAIWRLMVSLQYMAFFCAPLLLPAFMEYRQQLVEISRAGSKGQRARLERSILLGLALFIFGVSLFGSFVINQLGVMPLIKWNFFGLSKLPVWFTVSLTLATVVGAFLIGRQLILRYVQSPGWGALPSHERVLDLLTGCTLAIHLILFELGDRYLLHLMPLTLVVVGRSISIYLARFRAATLAACVVFAMTSGLWVRQTASRAEAQWVAAETLVADGISPDRISGMFEWASYHGEYHAFIVDAAQRNVQLLDNSTYFTEWLGERRRQADYLIYPYPLPTPPQLSGWTIIRTLTYQDMLLRDQKVYVTQRVAP